MKYFKSNILNYTVWFVFSRCSAAVLNAITMHMYANCCRFYKRGLQVWKMYLQCRLDR